MPGVCTSVVWRLVYAQTGWCFRNGGVALFSLPSFLLSLVFGRMICKIPLRLSPGYPWLDHLASNGAGKESKALHSMEEYLVWKPAPWEGQGLRWERTPARPDGTRRDQELAGTRCGERRGTERCPGWGWGGEGLAELIPQKVALVSGLASPTWLRHLPSKALPPLIPLES